MNNWPTKEKFSKELSLFKSAGVKKIRLMSQRDGNVCNACLNDDGKEILLEDALKNAPLPHPQCENEYCRCCFFPMSD